MAIRHQLLMCYYRNNSVDSNPYFKETNAGPGIIINNKANMNIIACIILTGLKSTIGSLTYKYELLEQFTSLSNLDEVMRLVLFFEVLKITTFAI